ncbi:MAG: SUMF1/EgtB/PvdO family nonheme iron enzyme [Gammaproteobacteria bacterium]|nr:SUMF1/EgtB/PvdO family nonheme iron enzyme [Gammaproteobacteria bacterium]
MGAAQKIIDKKTLQVLVPFNALSPMHFNEVAQKTVVEEIRAGRLVFKEGDRDNQSVYLLDGEISLLAGNEIVGAVVAGSDAGRHPIAQQQPRQVAARAKTNVVVARVDSSLLDIMLTWDQSSGYEVSEISDDDDDDWMTRILQSQTFLKLPPSNIQRLLMKVESVPVQAGDVIIQQGGEGDYFYIIKNGRCMVSRKPSANAKEVKLAELADGDAFGEDALVSDAKRNATITMMTDGVLMRLAKKDFVELLKEPLLNKLDYAGAEVLVCKGAEWLDVRLPGEFENVHIQGSRNIPLSALRLEANGLNSATKYIVCCDTGRRSASAAFVLSQRGFDVYVLTDGLGGVPAEALVGSAAAVAPTAPSEPVAAVVTLKPQAVPTATAEAASTSMAAEAVAALRENLQSLQDEKQTLESAQVQLVARVGALQEDLERLREESREQILELEQTLAESRQEGVAARNELQGLKDTLNTQRQADAANRTQAEALEAELTERRVREVSFQDELNALRGRIGELDAACAADAQWRASAVAEQAELQTRIDALQPQAEQAALHLARIQELDAALRDAQQHGAQSQTEQAQRLQELETALQAATTSLEQARRDTEQQQSAAQAEHAQALAAVQTAAAQQVVELQAQLAARLAAHEQQFAEEHARSNAQQQSDRQALAELQTHIETLTQQLAQQVAQATTEAADLHAQREQALAHIQELTDALAVVRADQSAVAAAAQAESERLRGELVAAEAAHQASVGERDALQSTQAEALQTQQILTAELEQAQARVRMLEADAGAQVTHLEGTLEELRQRVHADELERASLQQTQLQLQQERDALRAELDQAQTRVQALSADAGEQMQRLEAALETAHRELQTQQTEQVALNAALDATQTALTAELAAAQTLLDETHAALATAQAAADAVQAERDQMQLSTAELEARLAATEQARTQTESDLHAVTESLRAELVTVTESQATQQAQAEQRIRALEQSLADAQATAQATAQADAEHRAQDAAALAAAQTQRDALHNELTTATAHLERLRQQQSDAAASQDEQTHLLTQVREQLHAAENQVREADAARAELDARLTDMTATAHAAQTELEQSRQTQQQALAEAEANSRAALDAHLDKHLAEHLEQLNDLRSELDSARTALARELEQRGNLAQATQADFAAAKAEAAAALERSESALAAAREQLETAEDARRESSEQLTELRTAAELQQQALQTELDQLRLATTADIEATQAQMQRLREELATARKLSAGDSVGEELQRLHLLLDQAREEAASARADTEQWRERAAAASADDELTRLRSQLSDIQQRVDEAGQLRENAEQEVAQLREALQAREMQAHTPDAPSFEPAMARAETAPSRAGLAMGLAGGLLLGALGVGAVFWFGKPVEVIEPVADAAPASQVLATVPAPVVVAPTPAPAPEVAPEVAPETSRVVPPEPAASQAAIATGREFQDHLSVGERGPRLIEIAATRFAMGSGASSLDFNERPKHDVDLHGYAIGQYEVTFEEFDAFARATGRALPGDKGRGRGRRPVVNVSWEDATAYARWLSEQTGKRYRLPTEAEWEYAAGNLGRSLYWWGNTPGEKRANCFNCGSQWDARGTAPVGSFAANPLGLYDTAGNAIEWVQDCYHPDYTSAPTDGSAWVNVGCTRRVIRGGGFNSPANTLRLTKRDQQLSSMRMDDLGFRVARDL